MLDAALYVISTHASYVGPLESHPSVTVIDGDFGSLYEFCGPVPGMFTLTSVKETPMGVYKTWQENIDKIESLGEAELAAKRTAFEKEILKYVPKFKEEFRMDAPNGRILWFLYFYQDKV